MRIKIKRMAGSHERCLAKCRAREETRKYPSKKRKDKRDKEAKHTRQRNEKKEKGNRRTKKID